MFRFSSRRGRKTLAAQNYVGVISAGNTEIEILPKIGKKIRYCDSEYERVRRTFLAMLQELRDAPFKNLGCAELTTARMPLFEIFISAFLNEVSKVVRSGLRSDYQDWSGNERFLRGRLNFSEQLRLNHANSSRFAVEYSVYHVNRPENRLIKTALQFAARRSQNPLNRRRIKIASDHLSDVEPSTNPRADFAACKSDRNMTHYASALAWCRIFLASEAPVPFPGIIAADALLFPMDRIFENYVAAQLRRACASIGIIMQSQDHGKYLFDEPKRYHLRPDLVATNDNRTVILDTKWKLPINGKPAQGGHVPDARLRDSLWGRSRGARVPNHHRQPQWKEAISSHRHLGKSHLDTYLFLFPSRDYRRK